MKNLQFIIIAACVAYANLAQATVIDFQRQAANGYTLTGDFSYNTSLHGTGTIGIASIDTFNMQGALNGVLLGSWSLSNGTGDGFPLRFNFNTTTLDWVYGGFYPTAWDSVVLGDLSNDGGIGFVCGSVGCNMRYNGLVQGGSGLSSQDGGAQFSNSVRAAAVPEPSSFALLALGLAGLGYSRRSKAR